MTDDRDIDEKVFSVLFTACNLPYNFDETITLSLMKKCLTERIAEMADKDGTTLLIMCCRRSRLECVKYIVKTCKKAASICDNKGWYPIHWEACNPSSTPEGIAVLAKACPEALNAKVMGTTYGIATTPLELALRKNVPSKGCVTALVDHGAIISEILEDLLTDIVKRPLAGSREEFREECAKLLERHHSSRSYIHSVISNPHNSDEQTSKGLESIINCDTSVSRHKLRSRKDQAELLMSACTTGKLKTATIILEDDPEVVNITDKTGTTMLQFAEKGGNVELVKLIRSYMDRKSIIASFWPVELFGDAAYYFVYSFLHSILVNKVITNQRALGLLKRHAERYDEKELFTIMDGNDMTLLSTSCANNRTECTLYIVKRCKEAASICDKRGWYPLHYEARYSKALLSCAALLEAYPEAVNKRAGASRVLRELGETPLEIAIRDSHQLRIPQLLVEHGAEITDEARDRLLNICHGSEYLDTWKMMCNKLLERVLL